MGYKCPKFGKGHKEHANRKSCPDYVPPATTQAPTSQAPPPAPPPPEGESKPPTSPPKPPEEPKKEGFFDRAFGWSRSTASTVSSPEVPTAAQSYVLDGDDVLGFWQIVFSVAEMVINFVLRLGRYAPGTKDEKGNDIGGKPLAPLPPELCDMRSSNARKMLIGRNMTHVTSQLFISAGVRTKAEAHALISEGEGIVAFGGTFLGIGQHIVSQFLLSEWWASFNAPAKPGEKKAGGFDFSSLDPLGLFSKKEAPAAPA